MHAAAATATTRTNKQSRFLRSPKHLRPNTCSRPPATQLRPVPSSRFRSLDRPSRRNMDPAVAAQLHSVLAYTPRTGIGTVARPSRASRVSQVSIRSSAADVVEDPALQAGKAADTGLLVVRGANSDGALSQRLDAIHLEQAHTDARRRARRKPTSRRPISTADVNKPLPPLPGSTRAVPKATPRSSVCPPASIRWSVDSFSSRPEDGDGLEPSPWPVTKRAVPKATPRASVCPPASIRWSFNSVSSRSEYDDEPDGLDVAEFDDPISESASFIDDVALPIQDLSSHGAEHDLGIPPASRPSSIVSSSTLCSHSRTSSQQTCAMPGHFNENDSDASTLASDDESEYFECDSHFGRCVRILVPFFLRLIQAHSDQDKTDMYKGMLSVAVRRKSQRLSSGLKPPGAKLPQLSVHGRSGPLVLEGIPTAAYRHVRSKATLPKTPTAPTHAPPAPPTTLPPLPVNSADKTACGKPARAARAVIDGVPTVMRLRPAPVKKASAPPARPLPARPMTPPRALSADKDTATPRPVPKRRRQYPAPADRRAAALAGHSVDDGVLSLGSMLARESPWRHRATAVSPHEGA
jgi:hypothetical protein